MTGIVPGTECWRIERATRAAIIIDAEDYFRLARAAMLAAEERIMLIGWEFDPRIDLGHSDDAPDAPRRLGEFMLWLVARKPALRIKILRWDPGLLKPISRLRGWPMLLRWMLHRQIDFRFDGRHPIGGSHHQKIVVVDDCLAFAGGIDITAGRWDTRDHRDDDPGRLHPGGDPYIAWHDATTILEGPAAHALGELARDRWQLSGGGALPAVAGHTDSWPAGFTAQFTDISVAISRTIPEMPDQQPVLEIEALYLELIRRARRFIYAESQYFASRRIAEAIAARLAEPDPPEIVLVNPLTAEGWLEPIAMDSARARLYEALHAADLHGRFRIYHPYTAGGSPIYVHAKILIVDGEVLRIGSSNMNNRSLRLDTECDVTIDCAFPGNSGLGDGIMAIRDSLLAEHLGVTAPEIAIAIEKRGSLIAAIESLRSGGRSLRPYETPDLSTVKAWLADNEALDPEGPGEMFESLTRRGLFRKSRLWRRFGHRRSAGRVAAR